LAFAEEDNILIKVLRQEHGYGSHCSMGPWCIFLASC